MSDISGIVKQTGVALEATAFGMFGAAVANQVGPKLAGLFGGKGAAPSADPNSTGSVVKNIQPGVWDPTPYASPYGTNHIVGGGEYDPKTKFLFTVEFKLHPNVAALIGSLIPGTDPSDFGRDLSFTVKQIDLPTYEFEYEQVNMYNFKTKVLKQINHRELNISFYDDIGNHAMSFVKAYMQALVPISRRSDYPADTKFEDHGFAFTNTIGSLNTATRNALPGNATSVILEMRINQFYITRSATETAERSVKYNTFTFTNPRLSSIDISDQDHEQGGQANTIAAVFDFDTINITTSQYGIEYDGMKNPTGDFLHAAAEAEAQINRGPIITPGKTGNPFVDIIARQGQRMVQTSVGGMLNKTFGGVAGGALSGTIYQVTGALGEATNRSLGNVGTAAAGSISIPRTPFVKDNSTPSSQSKDLSTQTPSNDGWSEG